MIYNPNMRYNPLDPDLFNNFTLESVKEKFDVEVIAGDTEKFFEGEQHNTGKGKVIPF